MTSHRLLQSARRLLTGAAGTAALSTCLAASACPRSADPALKGPSVGQDMVVNGLPVQMQQVSAREKAGVVADRVEQSWRQAGFDVKRQRMGPWWVVAALSDDCLATLQLMDRGNAVGFFAIGQPTKARTSAASRRDISLPPGASVVSTVSGRDGPRSGVTTTIAVRTSVADTFAHYERSLQADGWQGFRSRGLRTSASLSDAAMLSAQRNGELVQIVIFPAHGSTTAVINRARRPLRSIASSFEPRDIAFDRPFIHQQSYGFSMHDDTHQAGWPQGSMSCRRGPCDRRAGQQGQAAVEYAVVLALTTIALVVAVVDPSVIDQLLEAIKGYFKAYSFAISVAPQQGL